MRQVLTNIKVSEFPNLLAQLGLSAEQEVNLIVEEASENFLVIIDRVGQKAKEKGLTEDKNF
ncbi:MAG: hypothetical protein ACFB4I_21275 [Cyanophyceae cyanobacterium]